jgi:hypothetical protein
VGKAAALKADPAALNLFRVGCSTEGSWGKKSQRRRASIGASPNRRVLGREEGWVRGGQGERSMGPEREELRRKMGGEHLPARAPPSSPSFPSPSSSGRLPIPSFSSFTYILTISQNAYLLNSIRKKC